ncbi:MAG: TfuA-like protein [Ilumatobacteraceae bacterium]
MTGASAARVPPVVFVGPSLGRAEARAIAPDAVFLPPARCGDVLSVLRLRPAAIVLIDGFYDTTPAPWHKELLWALELGIPVVGAASMGALRAAELERFGMVGVGQVFASYRDGSRHADADVAVLQLAGSGGDQAVTAALVDIEASVVELVGTGLLSDADGDRVLAAARSMHFSRRTTAGALDAAGLAPAAAQQILTALDQRGGGAVKRSDAEAALRLVVAGVTRPVVAEPVARTVHIVRLAGEAALRPLGRPEVGLPVAEQLLASDETIARAAGVAGGLLRAADGPLVAPHEDAAAGRDALAKAAQIVLDELGDHPAAATSARRLRRLGATPMVRGGGPDVRPILAALAGTSTTPELIEILAGAAARALGVTAAPWRRGVEPSDDGLVVADALLPDSGENGDPLEIAAGTGRRRLAGELLDLIRIGGAATAPLARAVDPFDAPLLDGLALMRAVDAIGPIS